MRRHADRQIAREALGDGDLDLELGQIDHAQHRCVGGDVLPLLHHHLADLAVERRAQRERVDLALQLGHHRALAVGQQTLVAQIETGAAILQPVALARLRQRELRLLERVLRAGDVDLRHRPAFERAPVAFQIALGGDAIDFRLVEQLARLGAGHLCAPFA